MHIDNLVHMANRIGEFFEAMPDRTEALDGIATHIRKFWEPRMRRELLLALDRAEGAESAENPGLSPIVHAALLAHRERLAPASLV